MFARSFTNVSFVYNVTRNRADITLHINSLTPIFTKPVFNALLRDFTHLKKTETDLLSVLTWPSIINFTKQLRCLVEQTMRLFGQYLLSSVKATLFKGNSDTEVIMYILRNF